MRFGEDLSGHQRAVAYYGVALLVTVFGFLGILTIGYPFLFIGVLLFALGPVRDRRDVLWPPLLGVAAFTAGFIAFVPISCTYSSGSVSRCVSPLGWFVPGGWPVGVGLALASAFGAALLLRSWIRASGHAHR